MKITGNQPTHRPRYGRLILLAMLVFVAKAEADLEVVWGPGHQSVEFRMDAIEGAFPGNLLVEGFPRPGVEATLVSTKEWPAFVYSARWSMAVTDWPEAHRDSILDHILMRVVDVKNHPNIYPNAVKSVTLTEPPQIAISAAPNPLPLADALRGKAIPYSMITKGGFGAPDAVIRTALTAGAGADGKSIFYVDSSESIDKSLEQRVVIFCAYDAGDEIRFEIRGYYVAQPRSLLRETTLDRIEDTSIYLVGNMEPNLVKPPTAAEAKRYVAIVGDRPPVVDAPPTVETSPSDPVAEPVTEPVVEDAADEPVADEPATDEPAAEVAPEQASRSWLGEEVTDVEHPGEQPLPLIQQTWFHATVLGAVVAVIVILIVRRKRRRK
jgi:hypothetical protein